MEPVTQHLQLNLQLTELLLELVPGKPVCTECTAVLHAAALRARARGDCSLVVRCLRLALDADPLDADREAICEVVALLAEPDAPRCAVAVAPLVSQLAFAAAVPEQTLIRWVTGWPKLLWALQDPADTGVVLGLLHTLARAGHAGGPLGAAWTSCQPLLVPFFCGAGGGRPPLLRLGKDAQHQALSLIYYSHPSQRVVEELCRAFVKWHAEFDAGFFLSVLGRVPNTELREAAVRTLVPFVVSSPTLRHALLALSGGSSLGRAEELVAAGLEGTGLAL